MLFNGSSLSYTAGQSASSSKGIKEMYATPFNAARQVFITEASRSYSQVPQLAQALQKAAQEVKDFAIDLVEALGNVHGRLDDYPALADETCYCTQ